MSRNNTKLANRATQQRARGECTHAPSPRVVVGGGSDRAGSVVVAGPVRGLRTYLARTKFASFNTYARHIEYRFASSPRSAGFRVRLFNVRKASDAAPETELDAELCRGTAAASVTVSLAITIRATRLWLPLHRRWGQCQKVCMMNKTVKQKKQRKRKHPQRTTNKTAKLERTTLTATTTTTTTKRRRRHHNDDDDDNKTTTTTKTTTAKTTTPKRRRNNDDDDTIATTTTTTTNDVTTTLTTTTNDADDAAKLQRRRQRQR